MDATRDFTVEDHGSIIIVQPLTAPCREWLQENTDGQWWAGGLAVEPRYVDDLIDGMMSEGFAPAKVGA